MKKPNKKPTQKPDASHEDQLRAEGYRAVIGIDEAGRGPLAGPVVVAAVCFNGHDFPAGLNDSKKLSAARRHILFDEILKIARVSIVSQSARTVDQMNIRAATLSAMAKAARSLDIVPDFALIDGRDYPDGMPCPGKAIIGGDSKSVSIAAASIIAKTIRDQMMIKAAKRYQGFGFEKHMGYGTQHHMQALLDEGPVAGFHRWSFAPVRAADTKKARLRKTYNEIRLV